MKVREEGVDGTMEKDQPCQQEVGKTQGVGQHLTMKCLHTKDLFGEGGHDPQRHPSSIEQGH